MFVYPRSVCSKILGQYLCESMITNFKSKWLSDGVKSLSLKTNQTKQASKQSTNNKTNKQNKKKPTHYYKKLANNISVHLYVYIFEYAHTDTLRIFLLIEIYLVVFTWLP